MFGNFRHWRRGSRTKPNWAALILYIFIISTVFSHFHFSYMEFISMKGKRDALIIIHHSHSMFVNLCKRTKFKSENPNVCLTLICLGNSKSSIAHVKSGTFNEVNSIVNWIMQYYIQTYTFSHRSIEFYILWNEFIQ